LLWLAGVGEPWIFFLAFPAGFLVVLIFVHTIPYVIPPPLELRDYGDDLTTLGLDDQPSGSIASGGSQSSPVDAAGNDRYLEL
jgi:hypothetical protein